MKRYIYILIWLLSPFCMKAQTTIVKAQYWFDGQYSTVQTTSTGAAILYHTELIDVSALNNGLHTLSYRFKDSRGIWGVPVTKFFTKDNDNTGPHFVSEYQVWFDNDYSTLQVGTATGSSFNINTDVDVTGLTNGLHTISCRFKDSRGIWSAPLIKFFSKDETGGLHEITKLQYWFNEDFSNAKAQEIIPTNNFNLNENVDISELSLGVHSINYRFQDDIGKWSPVYSVLFGNFGSKGVAEMHPIVAMEYWFNGNSSESENTPITETNEFALDTKLDITNLGFGLHYVSYRFQDDAGQWSPAYSKFFAICKDKPIPEMHEITELEFWFNGDRTTRVNELVSSETELVIDKDLSLPDLDQGLHIISYRFKDEAGKWSTAISRFFSNYPGKSAQVNNKIVAYRYWIDTDIASTEEKELETPVKTFKLDEILSGNQIPTGTHNISYQFRDKQGNWSPAITESYTREPEPIVSITASEVMTCQGTAINFTADITDADQIEWDFGDGTTSTNANPVHTYLVPGNYNVSATVTDSESGRSAADNINGIIINPTYIEIQEAVICQGSSYNFGGIERNITGTYTHTFSSENGCDSTVTLNLTVNPVYNITDEVTICENELPYQFGTQSLSSGGTFSEVFQSKLNCDSTVTLTLNINPVYNTTDEVTICENELPYQFGTQSLSSGGTFSEVFQSKLNCDSTVTLTLNINPVYNTTDEVTICENELPYQFGTQSLSSGGTFSEVFQSKLNCDSTVTLTLNINPVYNTTDEVTICENELPYQFGTQSLNSGGTFSEVFQSKLNCDSTVTLTLNINPVYNTTDEVTICENELPYQFGTQSLNSGGTFSEIFQSKLNCDSTVTLTLNVQPEYNTTDEVTICENELPYQFGTQSLSSGGTFSEVFQSKLNCDSTVTLTLNINPEYNTTDEVTICENELPYQFGTQSLSSGGTFSEVFQSKLNCDSTVTLTLNVNPEYNTTDEVTICENELPYQFGTQSLSSGGTFSEVFQSKLNCDSTVTLTLNVKPEYNTTDEVTICENELPYQFGTQSLSSEGTFSEVFQSKFNCDSTVTLTLNVKPKYSNTDQVTICENELPYQFGTQSLTASGIYTETFQAKNGCDSVITLDLNVNPSYRIKRRVEIDEDDFPYYFESHVINSPGTYTESLLTKNGCDSILILTLNTADEEPPRVRCNTMEIVLSEDGMYTLSEQDIETISSDTRDNVSPTKYIDIDVNPSAFTCEHIGETSVRVSATDEAGNEADCEVLLSVRATNKEPKIDDLTDLSVDEDSSIRIALHGITGGTACERWNVNLSASSANADLVSGLTIEHSPSDSTGILEIDLAPDKNGTDSITVEVQDSLGGISSSSFLLTVNPVNDSPVLVNPLEDQSVQATKTLDFTINKLLGETFNDIDDSTLTYEINCNSGKMPDWITTNEEIDIYTLFCSPVQADTGCYSFTIKALDLAGEMATDTFEICVTKLLVGIDDMEEGLFEINLYPNPTKGNINIDLGLRVYEEIEIQILDISGSEILRKKFMAKDRIQLDLSKHVSGTYLVLIDRNNSRIVRKLVLDKK